MIMQDRMLTMYQLPLCGDPIRSSNSLDVTIHWQVETTSALGDSVTRGGVGWGEAIKAPPRQGFGVLLLTPNPPLNPGGVGQGSPQNPKIKPLYYI